MKNTDFFFPRLFARIELWRRLCSRCPRSVSTWQTSQRTTCYSRQSATSKAAKWTTFSPKLRISTMRWCVSRLWNVKLYTHTALCINTERWISVCPMEDDGVDSSYYLLMLFLLQSNLLHLILHITWGPGPASRSTSQCPSTSWWHYSTPLTKEVTTLVSRRPTLQWNHLLMYTPEVRASLLIALLKSSSCIQFSPWNN